MVQEEYVTCREGDVRRLPFTDNYFDVVVSAVFLHMVRKEFGEKTAVAVERMMGLGEVVRALMPGGAGWGGVVWDLFYDILDKILLEVKSDVGDIGVFTVNIGEEHGSFDDSEDETANVESLSLEYESVEISLLKKLYVKKFSTKWGFDHTHLFNYDCIFQKMLRRGLGTDCVVLEECGGKVYLRLLEQKIRVNLVTRIGRDDKLGG
ncbi:hypothetical protein RHGRI_015181 [Rhododendron griersonianum]|uniref:Methyltransferase type 11 domain-containing protein n=1 Tax=Rhododendron griersonianum TaxID=479676 RepID=A0AAV6KCU5_9ERIC|nr:hypothetical protein RHGRI_015181 [Rhododendron griersonianum]